jgi:tetratricopeptide (TPR) repeat protein
MNSLEGLNIARQIEHREWTSVLLTNLGLAVRKQGNYTDAEQYLQEGLDLAKQIGIPPMIANALYECGNLYLDQKRIEDAEKTFKEMFIVIPDGWQDLTALAQYGLARLAAITANKDDAVRLGEMSAISLEKIGQHKAKEVRNWVNLIKDKK